MKIKSLIIILLGAVVIGMSTMSVTANEIERTSEIPIEEVIIEQQNSEEPMLIAPGPADESLEDKATSDEDILPLLDRGEPVPSDSPNDDGSEMSLISQLESKDNGNLQNQNIPVIIILGVVGFLVILLLVLNRRK